MRVVTFQDKYIIEDILSNDVFKFNSKGRRTKEDDITSNNQYPIYCFASIPHCRANGICIHNIYKRWAHLIGFYRLDDRDMLELEIPDEYIHVVKQCNGSETIPLHKIYDYASDDLEVVIYEIRKEWIVSLHNFGHSGSSYGIKCIKVNVFNEDANPIILTDYKISGDSYADKDFYKKLPDKLYRPVRIKELYAYVNISAYNNIFMELLSFYYPKEEVLSIIEDRDKLSRSLERFKNVLVY